MGKERILFIEDDAAGREVGVFNLEKAGFEVDAAGNGEEGLASFRERKHDLVITDVRMPGISGLEVLAAIKEQAPEVPVLVITAYSNVDLAVEAMRAGAYDFIGKPFNREHLRLTVNKALESRRLKSEVRTLRIRSSGVERPIVYESAAMGRVLEIVDRVAPSEATMLVTGESGTGKELVARRIHVRSGRAAGPFVTVNAAAMPAELLESELFGHRKGAFTGATRDRVGRFRQAHGGTIFLDEIGELALALQGKLLRVLQEKVVEVVGQDEPVAVDVRVVAATNRNLEREVEAGRFRQDLWYRLNVVQVRVPPLRDRPEDIEILARHFVDRFADGRELTIHEKLLEVLRGHRWPGNIRELENVCQRLVLLCPGEELRVEDLPPGIAGIATESDVLDPYADFPSLPEDGLSLVDLERRVIERVLELKGGNVTQTALYLKIPRHVLAYRMEKYGIPRKG